MEYLFQNLLIKGLNKIFIQDNKYKTGLLKVMSVTHAVSLRAGVFLVPEA